MIYYLRGRNSLNLALKFAILLRIPCIAEMAGLMCGKPGRSVGCHIEGGEKLSYHEEEEVRYRCDTYDGFIRGKTVRKCINGSWTGSIPIIYHRLEIRSAYQSTTLPDLSNSLSIDGNSSTCISTEMQSEGFWMGMLNASFNINAIKVVFPRNIQVKVQVLVKEDKRSEIPCGNYSGSTGTDSGLLFICPPGAIGTSVIIQDLSKVLHRFVICEVTLYTLQASPCLRPDIPFNVNAHKTVGVHFTEYTFSCKSGYYLEGPQRILCNSYGIWQDKAPECKPSSCGKLPDIANGILIANSTTIGNTAWLICNEGYRPLSNDEITCLRTGEWTKPYPLCAPIQCDDKPKIPHGSAVLLTYSAFYGSPLKIECDEGFFPKGNISRMCELDGTWGDLDICVEITCLSHNDNEMTNGEWLQLNNSKSIKVLMCQQGYYIEGSPAITQCLPNGSWSYTTAVCRSM
ncbi:CUB and sushi domain-containing protein 1-like isoform X1 [Stegodyphus dumicola]|uniref:CUB and sushi domain-containing protein 1-like isoform X1 n=1 Tax=Stegodyphus dumicola TaxID=202533 RepID=UPI0015AA0F24|nr:CUB and sushi domain-containing protein 1-like isoform X1 [Stegodyphus dumicola]